MDETPEMPARKPYEPPAFRAIEVARGTAGDNDTEGSIVFDGSQSSDRSLKDGVAVVEGALARLGRLRP